MTSERDLTEKPRVANWQLAAMLLAAACPLLLIWLDQRQSAQMTDTCQALQITACPSVGIPWMGAAVITALLIVVGLPVLTAAVGWIREHIAV